MYFYVLFIISVNKYKATKLQKYIRRGLSVFFFFLCKQHLSPEIKAHTLSSLSSLFRHYTFFFIFLFLLLAKVIHRFIVQLRFCIQYTTDREYIQEIVL